MGGRTLVSSGEVAAAEEGPRPRLWGRFHTFDSLRERNFRWFWLGMLGSFAAMQMQILARGWLVVDTLHGSELDLGIVASSFALPVLLFSLFGGAVTDRVEKRKLLIFTQGSIGLVTLGIALLIVTDKVLLWHIIVSSLVTGTIFAFNMPGRQSMVTELVGPKRLPNAVALTSAGMNLSRVGAPALAGVLMGVIGVGGVYFLIVGCYAFVVLSLLTLPARIETQATSRNSLLGDLKDGLSYVRRNSQVSNLLILAFAPIVFAMSYQALMPVFAKDILGVGSSGLGFLMGAVGVGALFGTLGLASLFDFQRKGPLMIALLLIFGAALILFAFSTSLYLSLAALFLVGLGSMGYTALNNTLILSNTDPQMRGRVISMYMMTWGLMPLGLLPASAVAEAIGAPGAVTIGAGLLIVSTIAVVLLRPQIRRLK
ncbi:MAG: MFS transporter [Dehalococcoidia bacterium]